MSSFVKHQDCDRHGCLCEKMLGAIHACTRVCFQADIPDYIEGEPRRPIFEQRDTDEEARLDRKARARECK